MCPAVLQKGSCDNPNCRYAHDNAELRTTSVFFKSKMCMFATRGRCKNGDACRFAHTDEDLIEPQVPNGLDAETQPGNRQDASNAMAKAMQSHLMLMRLGAMRDRGGMPRSREALVDGLSLIPVPATPPHKTVTIAILQGSISKEAQTDRRRPHQQATPTLWCQTRHPRVHLILVLLIVSSSTRESRVQTTRETQVELPDR